MKYENLIVGQGDEPLDEINSNESNWRIHEEEQMDALEGTYEEVGTVQRVIINLRTSPDWGDSQNVKTLVDGHARVELFRKNGETTIPALYIDVSPQQEALVLASLDPITGMATTDKQKLDDLFSTIDSENEKVLRMMDEIAERESLKYGRKPIEDVPPKLDEAEELRVKWGVESGQLWQLGDHRLICGDCTDEEVLNRLMAGGKANLCFTSPPYWVGKSYEAQDSVEAINEFIIAAAKGINLCMKKDESRIIINSGTGFTTAFDKRNKRQTLLLIDKWTNAFFDLKWNLRHVRHWLKHGQLMSTGAKSDMIDQHCEWFCTFENDEGTGFDDRIDYSDVDTLLTFYNINGVARGREQGSLGDHLSAKHWALKSYWDDIHGNANSDGHVAAFPLELVERHVVIYSQKGEIVFEPFMGSGTTIIGCERFSRLCRGVEISPAYCAVTIQRYKDVTGNEPVLIDG